MPVTHKWSSRIQEACTIKQEVHLVSLGMQTCWTFSADSSDDELLLDQRPEFYDSDLDDRDEAWVERRRKGRKSDAILSCPACFTTLCIDCQRHEKYVTQYRAMLVLNCKVVENQRLRFPVENRRNNLKRSQKTSSSHGETIAEDSQTKDEVYKPVCCSVCETEVAVMDKKEVYHFFNIMPSYS
eukprot:c20603_g1_i2 orf=362-913(-)